MSQIHDITSPGDRLSINLQYGQKEYFKLLDQVPYFTHGNVLKHCLHKEIKNQLKIRQDAANGDTEGRFVNWYLSRSIKFTLATIMSKWRQLAVKRDVENSTPILYAYSRNKVYALVKVKLAEYRNKIKADVENKIARIIPKKYQVNPIEIYIKDREIIQPDIIIVGDVSSRANEKHRKELSLNWNEYENRILIRFPSAKVIKVTGITRFNMQVTNQAYGGTTGEEVQNYSAIALAYLLQNGELPSR